MGCPGQPSVDSLHPQRPSLSVLGVDRPPERGDQQAAPMHRVGDGHAVDLRRKVQGWVPAARPGFRQFELWNFVPQEQAHGRAAVEEGATTEVDPRLGGGRHLRGLKGIGQLVEGFDVVGSPVKPCVVDRTDGATTGRTGHGRAWRHVGASGPVKDGGICRDGVPGRCKGAVATTEIHGSARHSALVSPATQNHRQGCCCPRHLFPRHRCRWIGKPCPQDIPSGRQRHRWGTCLPRHRMS
jgi:hypothetical protein